MSVEISQSRAVADANVWVARFVADDHFHRLSRAWLDDWLLADNEIVSPILLLCEDGGAFTRRTGDTLLGRAVVAYLERVPELRTVDIDATLGHEAAHLAIDLRLRGADAVSVALAAHLNLPLITWDQELLTRASAHIDIRTPAP